MKKSIMSRDSTYITAVFAKNHHYNFWACVLMVYGSTFWPRLTGQWGGCCTATFYMAQNRISTHGKVMKFCT